MTTNNEAFEATYPVPDGIWFHSDGDYINKDDTPNEYNNMWHTWQAATTEANKRIAELQVSNKRLREALHKAQLKLTYGSDEYNLAENALSCKPAQSLIEHDNEVLERAAKVCDRYHYIPDAAPYDCAKAIREMKA